MNVVTLCTRARDFLLGFVIENMPQSSARLCAGLTGTTACLAVPAIIGFAFKNPHEWQSIATLVGMITALGTVMAYALKVRKLNDPTDGGTP